MSHESDLVVKGSICVVMGGVGWCVVFVSCLLLDCRSVTELQFATYCKLVGASSAPYPPLSVSVQHQIQD